MYLRILPVLLLFCLASSKTMHKLRREGWHDGWPKDFSNKRLAIRQTATIYAWPSTGGRLELQDPGAFELEYLGIDQPLVETNCSADLAEEDDFVRKVRLLGGVFYPYAYLERRWRSPHDGNADIYTWLGWPEDEVHQGGVWMLTMEQTRTEMSSRQIGRIKLARTMQERCQAIEMCGGTFYAIPDEHHMVALEPEPSQNRTEAAACLQRRLERERTYDMNQQQIQRAVPNRSPEMEAELNIGS